MNIYVGNLAHSATEEQVKQLFAQFGEIKSVKIIKDKLTGNPRGFAFVEFPNNDEAQQALDSLNGQEFLGRPLRVNEAREQEPRGDRGPRSGGFGGSSNGPRSGGFGGGPRRPRY